MVIYIIVFLLLFVAMNNADREAVLPSQFLRFTKKKKGWFIQL